MSIVHEYGVWCILCIHALYSCTVLLHCTRAPYSRTILMHCTHALYSCTVLILYSCTALLHCTPALYSCTVLMHQLMHQTPALYCTHTHALHTDLSNKGVSPFHYDNTMQVAVRTQSVHHTPYSCTILMHHSACLVYYTLPVYCIAYSCTILMHHTHAPYSCTIQDVVSDDLNGTVDININRYCITEASWSRTM
jgi:hypothetical protein